MLRCRQLLRALERQPARPCHDTLHRGCGGGRATGARRSQRVRNSFGTPLDVPAPPSSLPLRSPSARLWSTLRTPSSPSSASSAARWARCRRRASRCGGRAHAAGGRADRRRGGDVHRQVVWAGTHGSTSCNVQDGPGAISYSLSRRAAQPGDPSPRRCLTGSSPTATATSRLPPPTPTRSLPPRRFPPS